jgi:hypothetical protein
MQLPSSSVGAERTPTFRELLDDLGKDIAALLHDEIDLFQKATLTEIRTRLLVLSVLSVLTITSVLALGAAAVLALARVLAPPVAALAVGLGMAVLTAVFGLIATRWLKPQE